MIRTIKNMALLMLFGMGLYTFLLLAQGRAAADLCDNHPAGSRVENLEDLEGTFFLTRMGPIPNPKEPGTEKVIFCAGLTMCETSCRLEIENGRVTRARYSAL